MRLAPSCSPPRKHELGDSHAAESQARQSEPQTKAPAGTTPSGRQAIYLASVTRYMRSGAETPMSESVSASTRRAASHAARRAFETASSTGRPSLGSTWQAV